MSATGAIAEEVLSSIRTVLAFGGEKREVERYSAEVAVARKSGIFRGILTGTTMGLMFGTIYGCYGLGLWYGVKIIKDEEQEPEFQNCTMSCIPGVGTDADISEIQVLMSLQYTDLDTLVISHLVITH